MGSSQGGTSRHPMLCSPPVMKDAELPYSFPPPPHFAGGVVPCAPKHPSGLFNAGPYGDVPCVWVGAVGRVDAKDGAAAQVRFPSA